ncbi:MAG TPA: DUF6288 domain-containing protein [Sedimentisphaerales bacterium]|nr:DUF6288 domain-containing protein [Sedimentisphaerales bacterium]
MKTTNKMSAKFASVVVGVAGLMCSMAVAGAVGGKDAYYTEEHVYWSRPNPDGEMSLGNIGVTGLKVRIYKGVVVKVEETVPGTPAEGQFKAGQIIVGINGAALKGKNPIVALGSALTQAEATDGKMTFEVQDAEDAPAKKVAITIPVLGAYSKTWPLTCEKSAKIIKQAAEYYSTNNAFKKKYFEEKGIGGALTCLFLLSTGDDKYVPCVKEYFAPFVKNPKGIGDHTWNNGYNGIACAEYYLRTGDKDVLPVLQHYCEDAKERQMFGCSWTHWGRGIWPAYVSGGLMNPAGCQVLTTLLLSKECGVDVDEKTLLGALRFWYRFTGHGTVPYGDHRPEGGLQSNGKDGMGAAAMLIASGAQGDTSIYSKARDYYSLSMIDSYPGLVLGHGDNGRGDAIWRGLTSSYLIDKKAPEYRTVMNRLEWWYDLSRRPSGALGNSTCQGFDDEGTGAALALTYTAPLKTLRISGAPRSKVAKDFKLPEHLWGRPADLAFLSVDDNPKYSAYGKSEPTHVPFWKFGGAYHKPENDLQSVPRKEMLKNVYHRNYMIRVQAAKALRTVGALDELEKLLQDPDPRVRRAGLDGIIDYNYWFGMGGATLKTEELTPQMLADIKKMLADPKEALWVVDGALMALSLASPQEINSCLKLIMPWTTHEDWWLRESSFVALMGLEKDDQLFQLVLPTLITMMVTEYHTMPREGFTRRLQEAMSRKKVTSPQGAQILAGFMRAVQESEVKSGDRAAEGGYNIQTAATVCLQKAPETALQVAKTIKERLPQLAAVDIVRLIGAPSFDREGTSFGFYTALKKLPQDQRQELTDILCSAYRAELIKRIKYGSESGSEHNMTVIDTVLDLAKLKNPKVDWQVIGKPAPVGRTWRYCSVDPQPAEVMDHRERERFRDITLPAGLEKWYAPGFDDSKWKAGKAPIGIGQYKQGEVSFANNSDWGSGEFLLARTTFELEAVDCDICRACVLAVQGFRVYLNGKEITSYVWSEDKPHYQRTMINADYLKKGTNVLAVYSNVGYDKEQPLGQIDVFLEGLKKNDLE